MPWKKWAHRINFHIYPRNSASTLDNSSSLLTKFWQLLTFSTASLRMLSYKTHNDSFFLFRKSTDFKFRVVYSLFQIQETTTVKNVQQHHWNLIYTINSYHVRSERGLGYGSIICPYFIKLSFVDQWFFQGALCLLCWGRQWSKLACRSVILNTDNFCF